MKVIKRGLAAAVFFFLLARESQGGEQFQETEKDFNLRSIGQLKIINPRGDITVQGWSLDKIRVKFKKRFSADGSESVQSVFDRIDYRYQATERDIEISTQYGTGLSIEDRIHEQEHPKIYADMTIFAPSNLKLQIWSVAGKVNLKGWNATTVVRSGNGTVNIEGVKAENLLVLCPSCTASFTHIQAALRCFGGTGSLDLNHIQGKSIYVESDSGPISLFEISGDQLYLSKAGKIDGQNLRGRVEFLGKQGQIDLREVSGFLSGAVENGSISAKIREWKSDDIAFLESVAGNIDITLPANFSADGDVWSVTGKTDVDFRIEKSNTTSNVGPEPASHLSGRIRDGGELLKIFTESGNIHVFKGKL